MYARAQANPRYAGWRRPTPWPSSMPRNGHEYSDPEERRWNRWLLDRVKACAEGKAFPELDAVSPGRQAGVVQQTTYDYAPIVANCGMSRPTDPDAAYVWDLCNGLVQRDGFEVSVP